jgi:hypothetical protein
MRASGRDDGMAISERQIAEGRWVNTIVYKLCDGTIPPPLNISIYIYCFFIFTGENQIKVRGMPFLTLTFPNLLAMDDATNMDAAEMILVVKKIEPSSPSCKENLRLKKYVIQDLSSWLA